MSRRHASPLHPDREDRALTDAHHVPVRGERVAAHGPIPFSLDARLNRVAGHVCQTPPRVETQQEKVRRLVRNALLQFVFYFAGLILLAAWVWVKYEKPDVPLT